MFCFFFKPIIVLEIIRDLEQCIFDKIKKVFNHGSDFNITYEDLNKLEYIEAVIKEGRYIFYIFNHACQLNII